MKRSHGEIAEDAEDCVESTCNQPHVAVVPWDWYQRIISDARAFRKLRRLLNEHGLDIERLVGR